MDTVCVYAGVQPCTAVACVPYLAVISVEQREGDEDDVAYGTPDDLHGLQHRALTVHRKHTHPSVRGGRDNKVNLPQGHYDLHELLAIRI